MVYTFPKGICPKVNIIAWLEFELACYNVTAQHISLNTTRDSALIFLVKSSMSQSLVMNNTLIMSILIVQ